MFLSKGVQDRGIGASFSEWWLANEGRWFGALCPLQLRRTVAQAKQPKVILILPQFRKPGQFHADALLATEEMRLSDMQLPEQRCPISAANAACFVVPQWP
jgi:hypothetical protein